MGGHYVHSCPGWRVRTVYTVVLCGWVGTVYSACWVDGHCVLSSAWWMDTVYTAGWVDGHCVLSSAGWMDTVYTAVLGG